MAPEEVDIKTDKYFYRG
jgi:hypothetical protein